MSKRLWEKGEAIDARVHQFTVGDDPLVDMQLVPWDILGSAAHAKMLAEVKLLTPEECTALVSALGELALQFEKGNFHIPPELEDCHTAIEDFLIAKLGDAGRKIHTGRSRNDQVLVCVRLYLRSTLLDLLQLLGQFTEVLLSRATPSTREVMPGYTHMQPAMPASIGMWLHAFAESGLQLMQDGLSLVSSLNTNPLGAASGFGASLPLKRDITAKLLGFDRVQRNPMAVQNSRGYFELKALQWAADVASSIEKLAWDFILFSTREFGFVTIPDNFTTGSSIMPQKHNPDVLELLRARAAKIRGAEDELRWVVAKLPSSYHRDFQYTKEPTIRGLTHLLQMLPIVTAVVQNFSVNSDALRNAMTDELFATYDAFRQVQAGVPFRDAYKQTAAKVKDKKLDVGDLRKDFDIIALETDKEIVEAKKDFQGLANDMQAWKKRLAQVTQIL